MTGWYPPPWARNPAYEGSNPAAGARESATAGTESAVAESEFPVPGRIPQPARRESVLSPSGIRLNSLRFGPPSAIRFITAARRTGVSRMAFQASERDAEFHVGDADFITCAIANLADLD